jgi:hypothetical protein
MAITIPVITEFSDKGLKSAKAAFANFKTDVNAASGTMNKFKAGSNAALDAVKANAGAFAMAGGAAIAGFAVKAVGEFQALALASGRFADATGLSVDQASRWTEVGGDIGIGADAIQGAIGKMNKALGTSPELFAKLGVDVVKTDTGLTDVNGTFLAVIDRLKRIKDPAERATVAAQLLGKGWMEMSQLINIGSYELKQSLDSVASGQVISEAELKKAKEFRDTMDEFGDMWSSFVINVGGWVSQFASDIGDVVNVIIHPMGTFRSIGLEVMSWFSDTPPKIEVFAGAMRDARDDQEMMNQSLKDFRTKSITGFVSGFEDAAVAIASATSQWKILTGTLDTSLAISDVEGQLAGVEAAAKKAFATGSDSDIQKYIELELQLITGLSNISNGMDDISNKEIALAFKTSGPQAAIDLARWIASGAEVGGLTIDQALATLGLGIGVEARASGGPVSQGSSYLVGERGPEIFTPSGGGMITPNSAIGGNTITVNVQGADPQAVVRALQDYNRTAGPIPVNTRAN